MSIAQRRLLPAIVGFLVSACTLAPRSTPPVAESVTELTDGSAGGETAGSIRRREWWKTFADPALDRIVAGVLASNFDLAAAVARVDQARARARIARAPLFPSIQPTAGVNEFDAPTNAGIGAQLDELGVGSGGGGIPGITLPDRLGITTYTAGVEFAYELDFWGRNRNDALAAGAEHLASESDYVTARIGILAETVRAYLELVNLRRQRTLASEIAEASRQRESLSESRYIRGLTDVSVLHRARQDARGAQAELPQIEALLANAEGRLRVLMGDHRVDLAQLASDSPPGNGVLQPVPPDIPTRLLMQRPDVVAARQRMEAARLQVGARRADLAPRLSLHGSIGLQSTESSEWFDPEQWFRNLSMNLLGPVFQGTRLQANLALAKAGLKGAVAAYGRSVITAVNEVEAALAGLEASRRRHSLLKSQSNAAQAEEELQEKRYVSGVVDYEALLASMQIRLTAKSLLATAERDLGLARLALHRALGGAWTPDARQAFGQEPPGRSPSRPPKE
ncbi:MAG: efflux transporter outer membrane subunit [Gemmatimonadota bacterium]|nr:efflux transporter outer membrane subunit [Gemmatimonadota bacterium]